MMRPLRPGVQLQHHASLVSEGGFWCDFRARALSHFPDPTFHAEGVTTTSMVVGAAPGKTHTGMYRR